MKYLIYKYLAIALIAWGMLFVIVLFGSLFSEELRNTDAILGSILIGVIPMIFGIIFLRNINKNQEKIKKYQIENSLLKIAKANNGILTESETSLSLNIPLETARLHLQEMCTKGYAEPDVSDTGVINYLFKAFIK